MTPLQPLATCPTSVTPASCPKQACLSTAHSLRGPCPPPGQPPQRPQRNRAWLTGPPRPHSPRSPETPLQPRPWPLQGPRPQESHLSVGVQHLDPLRGDEQVHLSQGRRVDLRVLGTNGDAVMNRTRHGEAGRHGHSRGTPGHMRLRHGAARKRAAGALACRLQLSAVQQRRAGEGAALRRGAGMRAGGRARAVPRGDATCLPARARPPSPWPPSSHCFPLEGSQAGPLGRERMSQGHKCHCRGKGVPRAGPLSMSPENVFQAGPAGWPPRCLGYISASGI